MIEVQRRLAAILAADVVGFSAMMERAEEATYNEINRLRREVMEPALARHQGRLIKTTGDGLLAEFASPLAAARCAIEIQESLSSSPDGIRLRIGLNLGDVIVQEDGDVYGEGINIAARLEGLADPGGILVSAKVHDEIEGKLDVAFDDRGEQQLKNISKPIRTYAWAVNGSGRPNLPAGKAVQDTREPASPDKPSIAVLPFANMSGDPEQEYFADGMVEEIITGLSRIKWLAVISRNSSHIYKNKPVPAKEAAEKFGVRYVLEGGVRKSGNRIRITAQLIDAETGAHLWAEKYDRLLDDVFALQDEITMCVLGAIEPNLRKAEIERVKRRRPSNLSAYDLVLRALPHVYASMPKETEAAIPLLEQALLLEPDYGAAQAFLALCFHVRFSRGGLDPVDRAAAIRLARAAVARGNDDATSIAVAAFVIALNEHDAATALPLFDRALELSSSNAFALACSAQALAFMGRSERAIERGERAIRLSPFDALNYRAYLALAVAHFHEQQYGEATEAARNVIAINPGFSFGYALLAASLVRLGEADAAQVATRSVLERQPSFTIRGFAAVAEFDAAVFKPLADAWRDAGLPQ